MLCKIQFHLRNILHNQYKESVFQRPFSSNRYKIVLHSKKTKKQKKRPKLIHVKGLTTEVRRQVRLGTKLL